MPFSGMNAFIQRWKATNTFRLVFAALLLVLFPADRSSGQDLPSGTIRIVVPFGPGGTGDLAARAIGQQLSESLRQPVVIENSVSAFGIRAAQSVILSPPDGRTILLGAGLHAVSPLLQKSLPYDPATDLTWVSTVSLFHFVFMVDNESPLKSIGDVIAAAKADPRRFNIGTIGSGSIAHLAALLFLSAAQIDVPVIPFKTTGEVITALKAKEISVTIDSIPGVLSPLQSGLLRPIAVSSPQALSIVPGVRTVAESGVPGYEVVSWNAFAVSAKTPESIVKRLNQETRAALEVAEVRNKLIGLGLEPIANSPEQARQFFQDDMNKWRGVIEKSNLQQK